MTVKLLGQFPITFSYYQFMVYDVSVDMPECEWTADHSNQGFARRQGTVCFAALLQWGSAHVDTFFGPYVPNDRHQRVIAVPFDTPTGRVIVQGMMEVYVAHTLFVPKGHYTLYAAQELVDEDEGQENICLFFHRLAEPAASSAIIKADATLVPPDRLLEDAKAIIQ